MGVVCGRINGGELRECGGINGLGPDRVHPVWGAIREFWYSLEF